MQRMLILNYSQEIGYFIHNIKTGCFKNKIFREQGRVLGNSKYSNRNKILID